MKKRILSMLLLVAMVVTALPLFALTVFATGTKAEEPTFTENDYNGLYVQDGLFFAADFFNTNTHWSGTPVSLQAASSFESYIWRDDNGSLSLGKATNAENGKLSIEGATLTIKPGGSMTAADTDASVEYVMNARTMLGRMLYLRSWYLNGTSTYDSAADAITVKAQYVEREAHGLQSWSNQGAGWNAYLYESFSFTLKNWPANGIPVFTGKGVSTYSLAFAFREYMDLTKEQHDAMVADAATSGRTPGLVLSVNGAPQYVLDVPGEKPTYSDPAYKTTQYRIVRWPSTSTEGKSGVQLDGLYDTEALADAKIAELQAQDAANGEEGKWGYKARVYYDAAADKTSYGVQANTLLAAGWTDYLGHTGPSWKPNDPFTGDVYAIRYYSHALTAEEIAVNHTADLAKFFKLNIAAYRLLDDEGRAAVAEDMADYRLTDDAATVAAAFEDAVAPVVAAQYEGVTTPEYVTVMAKYGLDIYAMLAMPRDVAVNTTALLAELVATETFDDSLGATVGEAYAKALELDAAAYAELADEGLDFYNSLFVQDEMRYGVDYYRYNEFWGETVPTRPISPAEQYPTDAERYTFAADGVTHTAFSPAFNSAYSTWKTDIMNYFNGFAYKMTTPFTANFPTYSASVDRAAKAISIFTVKNGYMNIKGVMNNWFLSFSSLVPNDANTYTLQTVIAPQDEVTSTDSGIWMRDMGLSFTLTQDSITFERLGSGWSYGVSSNFTDVTLPIGVGQAFTATFVQGRDAAKTAVSYAVYANDVKITSGNTTDSNTGAYQCMLGWNAQSIDFYAIRIYGKELIADEIARNHFADVAKRFKLNLYGMDTKNAEQMAALYEAVADISLTDSTRAEAQVAVLSALGQGVEAYYADYKAALGSDYSLLKGYHLDPVAYTALPSGLLFKTRTMLATLWATNTFDPALGETVAEAYEAALTADATAYAEMADEGLDFYNSLYVQENLVYALDFYQFNEFWGHAIPALPTAPTETYKAIPGAKYYIVKNGTALEDVAFDSLAEVEAALKDTAKYPTSGNTYKFEIRYTQTAEELKALGNLRFTYADGKVTGFNSAFVGAATTWKTAVGNYLNGIAHKATRGLGYAHATLTYGSTTWSADGDGSNHYLPIFEIKDGYLELYRYRGNSWIDTKTMTGTTGKGTMQYVLAQMDQKDNLLGIFFRDVGLTLGTVNATSTTFDYLGRASNGYGIVSSSKVTLNKTVPYGFGDAYMLSWEQARATSNASANDDIYNRVWVNTTSLTGDSPAKNIDADASSQHMTGWTGSTVNYYAIRYYDGEMTEAIIERNHFADVAKRFKLNLTGMDTENAEQMAALYNAVANISLTSSTRTEAQLAVMTVLTDAVVAAHDAAFATLRATYTGEEEQDFINLAAASFLDAETVGKVLASGRDKTALYNAVTAEALLGTGSIVAAQSFFNEEAHDNHYYWSYTHLAPENKTWTDYLKTLADNALEAERLMALPADDRLAIATSAPATQDDLDAAVRERMDHYANYTEDDYKALYVEDGLFFAADFFNTKANAALSDYIWKETGSPSLSATNGTVADGKLSIAAGVLTIKPAGTMTATDYNLTIEHVLDVQSLSSNSKTFFLRGGYLNAWNTNGLAAATEDKGATFAFASYASSATSPSSWSNGNSWAQFTYSGFTRCFVPSGTTFAFRKGASTVSYSMNFADNIDLSLDEVNALRAAVAAGTKLPAFAMYNAGGEGFVMDVIDAPFYADTSCLIGYRLSRQKSGNSYEWLDENFEPYTGITTEILKGLTPENCKYKLYATQAEADAAMAAAKTAAPGKTFRVDQVYSIPLDETPYGLLPVFFNGAGWTDSIGGTATFTGDVYAIRYYSRALTEAETWQNHFADLAKFFRIDIGNYLAMSNGEKAAVHEAMAKHQLTDDRDAVLSAYLEASAAVYNTLAVTGDAATDAAFREFAATVGLDVSRLAKITASATFVGRILALADTAYAFDSSVVNYRLEKEILDFWEVNKSSGIQIRIDNGYSGEEAGVRAIYNINEEELRTMIAKYGKNGSLTFGTRILVNGKKAATLSFTATVDGAGNLTYTGTNTVGTSVKPATMKRTADGLFYTYAVTYTDAQLLNQTLLNAEYTFVRFVEIGGEEISINHGNSVFGDSISAAEAYANYAIDYPEDPIVQKVMEAMGGVETGDITSAHLRENGELYVSYESGQLQKLGATGFAAREGYNEGFLTECAVENGILTLTLADSKDLNVANQIVGSAAPIKVCLKSDGENLLWTPEGEENWQILCTTDFILDGDLPLALLAKATDLGKQAAVTGNSVVFAVEGGYLSFRSREWKDDTDLATVAYYSSSKNQNFNIHSLREIPSNTPDGDVVDGQDALVGTVWKGASDDCTPLHINGTYIGANHGYNCIAKIPNTGKTEADIGSVWQNAAGQKFCLVRIADGKLWLCPFDDATMASGSFSKYCAKALIAQGDVLTHVSGATNTAAITATAANPTGDMQFYVAINAVERRVFLNGTVEIDPTVAGHYEAEFVDFYESYRILYLPAVLQYLMDNAGKNTNQSHHSEDIGEAYVTVYNTYRFHKNGACVVYTDYVFEKSSSLGMVSGVQSNTFGGLATVIKCTCGWECDTAVGDTEHNIAAGTKLADLPTDFKCPLCGAEKTTLKSYSYDYLYLPGTKTYNVPTKHDSSVSLTFQKADLVDPNTPVSSYFQMKDAVGSKAFNLGYNTEYGYGVPAERLPYLGSSMGFDYTSLKLYPHLFTKGTLTAGDSIDFISYRIPTEATTGSDFTVINWYWVGETIYLQLHTAEAVAESTVSLPAYMVGMTATVIEGSTSFTVHSETIADAGITVSSTGAGYAIIRLTPAN